MVKAYRNVIIGIVMVIAVVAIIGVAVSSYQRDKADIMASIDELTVTVAKGSSLASPLIDTTYCAFHSNTTNDLVKRLARFYDLTYEETETNNYRFYTEQNGVGTVFYAAEKDVNEITSIVSRRADDWNCLAPAAVAYYE